MKTNLKVLVSGILMGIAETIPGVSGSTIAVALDIYDDFISLLHDATEFAKILVLFFLKRHSWADVKAAFKQIDLRFGILLGLGMVIAIALFAGIIIDLLHDYPGYLFALLFGLVAASTITPLKELGRLNLQEIILLIISTSLIFILLGLGEGNQLTEVNPLYLFMVGFLAISAMTLPGISGSFIMLLLGTYEFVLSLVKSLVGFDLSSTILIPLAVFVSGILLGIGITPKVIKWSLKNHFRYTTIFLISLMLASLRILYPFQYEPGGNVLIKGLLLLAGVLLIFGLSKLVKPRL